MNTYRYSAYGHDGSRVIGSIEAEGEAAALVQVKFLGYSPYKIEPQPKGLLLPFRRTKPLDLRPRAAIVKQLSSLLDANITLADALSIAGAKPGNKKTGVFAGRVLDDIRAGQRVSEAFRAKGAGLANEECVLIAAAEQTGDLRLAFTEIARSLDARLVLQDRVATALVYPAILLIVAMAAIGVIASVLIPSLLPLFETAKVDPPLLVRAFLWFSEVPSGFVPAILTAFILSGVLARSGSASAAARGRMGRFIRRLPVIGPFMRLSERAVICRTLGILMGSGVSVDAALSATAGVSKSQLTRQEIQTAREDVANGKSLPDALKGVEVFDHAALQMIGIGVRTNRLPDILAELTNASSAALIQRMERFMTLLTPILTVVIGALVGSLIISVMQAILSVNELAL